MVRPAATASALRVLAVAAERELLISHPRSVVIYGRTLDLRELRWLIDGMDTRRTGVLDERGPSGETREITGTILGRLVRVQVPERVFADLLMAGALVGV